VPPQTSAPAGERLDSWKEISAYLKRDPRTLQRWEKTEGLPVHRHVHDSQVSVYAYPWELDAWLAGRKPTSPAETPSRSGSRSRLFWAVGLTAIVLLGSAAYYKRTLAMRAAAVERTMLRDPRTTGASAPSRDGRAIVVPAKDPTPKQEQTVAEPEAVTERSVLQDPTMWGAGAPSWDGRVVFYPTKDRDNKVGIVRYDVAAKGSQVVKVLNPPNYVEGIGSSPDGTQVTYELGRLPAPPEIHLLDTRTSTDRVLVSDPQTFVGGAPAWSRDGRHVAVMLYGKGGARLQMIDVADGSSIVLYRGPNLIGPFAFSPDDRFIAFEENFDIRLLPLSGGKLVDVAVGPSREKFAGWAPDRRLLFLSDRSGTNDLYGMTLQNGKPVGEPQLIRHDMNVIPLGTTRKGAFYFTRDSMTFDIYTAELDASSHVEPGHVLLPETRFVGQNEDPEYSPDGKLLAYVSGPRTSKRSIRIRTLSTGQEREFPALLHDVTGVRWYPDEKALLLNGISGQAGFGGYRMDITEERHIDLTRVFDGLARNPMFSPDGKFLYFNLSGKGSLIRLDLASGSTEEVPHPKGEEPTAYALSPNGSQIAYATRMNPRTNRLYIASSSGDGARMIQEQAVHDYHGLAWSADAKSLFYVPSIGNMGIYVGSNLVRLSLDTLSEETIRTDRAIQSMSIASDGRHIAWEGDRTAPASEISVLEHLFQSTRLTR
jgi:Tol biopolymer transport system component